jgi:hypothetical protein
VIDGDWLINEKYLMQNWFLPFRMHYIGGQILNVRMHCITGRREYISNYFFYMLCVEAAIHKKGNHKKVNHGYTCMTICLTLCVDLIY